MTRAAVRRQRMRTRQPRASVQSQRRLASGRVARELGGRGGQGAWWPDRGGEKYEQEREEGAQESSSVNIYTCICIIYCTCIVETAAVRDAWVVRGFTRVAWVVRGWYVRGCRACYGPSCSKPSSIGMTVSTSSDVASGFGGAGPVIMFGSVRL